MNTYRPGPCNEMDHILADEEPFTYCEVCGHIFKIGETTIGGDGYGDRCCGEADVQTATQAWPVAVAFALNAAQELVGQPMCNTDTDEFDVLDAALEEITL